jgi:hypothetical protein
MMQSCQHAANSGLFLSASWLEEPEIKSVEEHVVGIFRKRLMDHIAQLSAETQQHLRTTLYFLSEGRTALLNPTLLTGYARYGCVLNPAAMRLWIITHGLTGLFKALSGAQTYNGAFHREIQATWMVDSLGRVIKRSLLKDFDAWYKEVPSAPVVPSSASGDGTVYS